MVPSLSRKDTYISKDKITIEIHRNKTPRYVQKLNKLIVEIICSALITRQV